MTTHAVLSEGKLTRDSILVLCALKTIDMTSIFSESCQMLLNRTVQETQLWHLD